MTRYKKKNQPRRRDVTKIRIDESSFVDRPAQEGSVALFLKRDNGVDDKFGKGYVEPNEGESRLDYVNRFIKSEEAIEKFESLKQRAAAGILIYGEFQKGESFEKGEEISVLTSSNEGHTHLVWLRRWGDARISGETSMQRVQGDEQHHDHPWVIDATGNVVIGENIGHTHTVDMESIRAAMLSAVLEDANVEQAVATVVFQRRHDEAEFRPDETNIETLLAKLDSAEVVMKSAEGHLLEKSYLSDGSFPIRTESDLVNAIHLVDAEGDHHRAARSHIVKRARVLGLEDVLPDELLEIVKNAASTDVGAISKTEGSMEPKVKKNAGGDGDAAEKVASLESQLAIAKSFGGLNDSEKAHYATLDESGKTEFLAKSKEARGAILEDIAKGDPVLYVCADGTEIRKSAGDLVLKMAKDNDETRKRLAKAEALNNDQAFTKRAKSEMGNMAGEESTHVAIIKAIDGIKDEEVRKKAVETLTAANQAMAKNFTAIGSSENDISKSDSASANQKLEAMAKARVSEKGDDYFDAYNTVCNENPELARLAVG